MWILRQGVGLIEDQAGKTWGSFYAGHGEGKNNPILDDVRAGCRYLSGMWVRVDGLSAEDYGPLPRGIYDMQPPIDTATHGPYVLWLVPSATNNMHGRSGFGLHGDENNTLQIASEGCAVMARKLRELMWRSTDNRIKVIQ